MSIRRLLVCVMVAALPVWAAATAAAKPTPIHCRSVKTDRFYHLSPNGLFGAFSITATGAPCRNARPIASQYVRNPFSVDSPKHRTKKVKGWSCTWRADLQVSQQVSVTCTRSQAQIKFKDRLPNG